MKSRKSEIESASFKNALKTFNLAKELYSKYEYSNARKWFEEASEMFNDMYHDRLLLLYKQMSEHERDDLFVEMDTISDFLKECRKYISLCDNNMFYER